MVAAGGGGGTVVGGAVVVPVARLGPTGLSTCGVGSAVLGARVRGSVGGVSGVGGLGGIVRTRTEGAAVGSVVAVGRCVLSSIERGGALAIETLLAIGRGGAVISIQSLV